MAWNLDVHTIDVGQGESSLIVASDPAAVGPNATRAMLVDGGLSGYASTVHRYVAAQGVRVDHILASHYDDDHSGGLLALLCADNLYRIVDTIAQGTAVNAWGPTRAAQVASGAAAAYAVAWGAYGAVGGPLVAPFATAARANVGAVGDAAAALVGIQQVVLGPAFGLGLVIENGTRRRLAAAAGIAAANAIAGGGAGAANQPAIRQAIFDAVRSRVSPAGARFLTGGIYANTHVIDIGDTPHIPDAWAQACIGNVLIGTFWGVAPGILRARTTPALASEVLWNSGPNAMAAPANAPAVYALSALKMVWNAPPGAVPIASGQPDNDDSIGIVVRFNSFVHYSGGDLPRQGSELVASAVAAHGLPAPGGGAYPVPPRIATFKCGHHGANTATSQTFLNTAQPRDAFISCGMQANFQHPAPQVVARLHAQATIQNFHLTNCKYVTANVPASNGQPQLVVGNKSRVCGDNANVNLAPLRHRGDIHLYLSQAESSGPAGPGRQFHVTYHEEDTPLVPGLDNITF